MKIELLDEPELQFGYGRHIDIRYGISNWSPFDVDESLAPKKIKVAIIGTNETISELSIWLERCRDVIPAKSTNKPKLFPAFCGFNQNVGFRSTFVLDQRLMSVVTSQQFQKATIASEQSKIITQLCDLFVCEISNLADKNPDVIICALPISVVEVLYNDNIAPDEAEEDENVEEGAKGVDNFRRYLKAKAMQFRIPFQIILPHTYNEKVKYKSESLQNRKVQDEATRAWNFFTALYYKAGGTPWRLEVQSAEFTTCFVGISFYKSQFDTSLQTSVAQIFNERGKGVILRGGKALTTKEDPRPHLNEELAKTLLQKALKRYRDEHGNPPARIVLHKSSNYTDEECSGFKQAAQEEKIDRLDFLTIFKSSLRLYRNGLYPPLRGTYFSIRTGIDLLYTRGSVQFFETYPGMYIPRALEIRYFEKEETSKKLCEEILALTKMNWNNTQFDGGLPITLKCARQVGEILKYVEDEAEIEHRYSFYM